MNANLISKQTAGIILLSCMYRLPWIPEPSTVNNKLKRREGFSAFSTESVLKALILFCDWRGLIKESPR
jgi:hypothetical protein